MKIKGVMSVCLALTAAACGGGGSSSGGGTTPPPPPVTQSVGGIWQAQYTAAAGPSAGNTIKVVSIVTETGQFYAIGKNLTTGCAAVGLGQLNVSGNTVSGTESVAVVRFATMGGVPTDCSYSDGSTSANGTLNGSVAQRTTLNLTETATTSSGTPLSSQGYAFNFQSLYLKPSSLSTLAGNYTDGADTLSINANGVMFEQDPTTGCVLNGQIALVNATFNAYTFSFTYQNCTGSNASLNGIAATGVGTLDDTQTPTYLVYGVTAQASGKPVILIGELPRQ